MQQTRLLRWEGQEPSWNLPGAQVEGTRRATYEFIHAASASARYVRIERGQSTPVHSSSSDHFIVALRGQVEFDLEGTVHLLDELDILFIPGNQPYKYGCAGEGDHAFFLSVQTHAGEWPPTNWYETGEAGSALA